MNILLPISVLFFTSIILWFLVSISRRYLLLATVVVLTSIFTISLWQGVINTMGWAAPEHLMPNKFVIHWVYVLEPDSFRGVNGGIFLWVTDLEENPRDMVLYLFGYTPDKNEPRAIRIEYTRERHKQMQGIQQMLKDGRKIIGKKKGTGKKGDGDGEGEGREGRKNGKEGPGDLGIGSEGDYEFYDLMSAKFPDKSPEDDDSSPEFVLPR
jgi:hypothetical protein